jgi:pyruvate,water dikinase
VIRDRRGRRILRRGRRNRAIALGRSAGVWFAHPPRVVPIARALPALALALAAAACAEPTPACDPSGPQPARERLACEAEFTAQAARPLDAALPGAFTVKTIVDRSDDDRPYFLDTNAFPLHRPFALAHLGFPAGLPFVDQYLSPGRRFVLGAITYYEEPDVWAYELAPYDTASAELIARSFERLAEVAYFGDRLRFHPTSGEQEARAAELPPSIPRITTDELYRGITYQPLNLGETYARVRILDAAELATTYVSPRELVVLDRAPDDLTVVAGSITESPQTPLSHLNVLARQRRTPNMALAGAQAALAAHEGRWVRLTVRAFDWELAPVTAEEADAWFATHRPPPAEIPTPDYASGAIVDLDDVGVGDVARVGGKAANYGALRDATGVRVRDGLAIPVARYRDFLVAHGFDARIATMLAEPGFRDDAAVRKAALAALQADLLAAPLDAGFLAELTARLEAEAPGQRWKFRSSTNAEDLARHTGAGLYESKTGAVGDPARPIDVAVKTVWASVWSFRAFEERDYAGIDHREVAMAILVVPSFDDERANGVAITANVYDPGPTGEDAFFVNAQLGEASVVSPPPGVTADQLIHYFFHANQPATYYTHSNLIAPGTAVLTRAELFDLGQSLAAIRTHFARHYERGHGFAQLAMDVEWKLIDGATGREIWIKQARPYPGLPE